MTVVEINRKHYDIPSTWNDLKGHQLIAIMDVFYGQMQLLPAQIKIFKILTGISWWKLKWRGPSHYDDKLYLTDWLFQENTLTNNPVPVFRGCFGPCNDFDNLQVSEFLFADQNYRQYKDTGSINYLHALIAILYRPTKKDYNIKTNPDGDAREPYNDNLTACYSMRVARWPATIKFAILHWYEGCRSNLVNCNPEVYGSSEGGDPLYGLFSVMRGVAEKGIHGDLEKVSKLYIKVFMMELNELVAEGQRIKESTKTS